VFEVRLEFEERGIDLLLQRRCVCREFPRVAGLS
jgi:hypothetical protein